MHTFIITKLPNCILAYLQTYILAYLHASNMITSHLAIQQDHSISKLYGFHFDGHVRVLEELSLLKKPCHKNQTSAHLRNSQSRPPSPYIRCKPDWFSQTRQLTLQLVSNGFSLSGEQLSSCHLLPAQRFL